MAAVAAAVTVSSSFSRADGKPSWSMTRSRAARPTASSCHSSARSGAAGARACACGVRWFVCMPTAWSMSPLRTDDLRGNGEGRVGADGREGVGEEERLVTRANLHRNWAYPEQICTGTGLTPNRFAPVHTGTSHARAGSPATRWCSSRAVLRTRSIWRSRRSTETRYRSVLTGCMRSKWYSSALPVCPYMRVLARTQRARTHTHTHTHTHTQVWRKVHALDQANISGKSVITTYFSPGNVRPQPKKVRVQSACCAVLCCARLCVQCYSSACHRATVCACV